MIIRCPKCGKTGQIDSEGDTANDNENHITYSPPDGFVKIQHGWSNDKLHLYCRNCGVAADAVV